MRIDFILSYEKNTVNYRFSLPCSYFFKVLVLLALCMCMCVVCVLNIRIILGLSISIQQFSLVLCPFSNCMHLLSFCLYPCWYCLDSNCSFFIKNCSFSQNEMYLLLHLNILVIFFYVSYAILLCISH